MKLHLCCGDVYLKGYVNVDIGVLYPYHFKSGEMKERETDLQHYYKGRTVGSPKQVVIDMYGDITSKKFWDKIQSKSCEEVVMINAIEHFEKSDAEFVVSNVWRVLRQHGRYILDYPDLDRIVRLDDADKKMRLIYGSRRNRHVWGYDATSMRKLLKKFSVITIGDQVVKHEYPSVGVVAEK